MNTPKPPGWGEDPLSKEIEWINENIHSVFSKHEKIFGLLVQIQGAYETLRRGLKGLNEEELNVVFFLSMSYGAYLGAIRLALGGQLAPAYMVMRGCLENALYAFRIYKNPDLFNAYKDRHKGDSERKESRNNFKLIDIFNDLKNHSSEIGASAKNLYDFTIDLGAHPNVEALRTNLSFDQENKEFQFYYVTDLLNDPAPFTQCIDALVQTAAYSLKIFEIIFENTVSELGISDEIEGFTKISFVIQK